MILIVWHAGGLAAIEPASGAVVWQRPFRTRMETPIATPVWQEPHLLVSAFFNGSRLYRLERPEPRLQWKGASDSGVETDGIHALMNSPVIDGDHIYGICSYGQLRCLRLATGERVWETQAVTREKARNASAFVSARRPLFHQQRPWRADHCPPLPGRLYRDQPDVPDPADIGARGPAGTGGCQLVASSLRRPERLRAE